MRKKINRTGLLKKVGTRVGTALKQESTWRGIIGIATAAGVGISPALATSIIAVGLTLIGGINIVKKD